MGIIAYELLLLGIVSIFLQKKWIFRVRKYLMMGFLTSGMILLTISLRNEEKILFLYFLICTILLVVGCMYVLVSAEIKKKTRVEEIIYLPAGEYETVIADNYHSPEIQVKYLLRYKGQIYVLSTVPPEGSPALIMHTVKNKGSDVITASIAIDDSTQPMTIKEILKKVRTYLIFIAAALLPVFYKLWDSGVLRENYMESCLILVVGYIGSTVTRGSKVLLNRCVYYFGRFCEIAGWISILVKVFM